MCLYNSRWEGVLKNENLPTCKMIAIVIFRKKFIVLSHRYLKCGPQYGPFVKIEMEGKITCFDFKRSHYAFCMSVCMCVGVFFVDSRDMREHR